MEVGGGGSRYSSQEIGEKVDVNEEKKGRLYEEESSFTSREGGEFGGKGSYLEGGFRRDRRLSPREKIVIISKKG